MEDESINQISYHKVSVKLSDKDFEKLEEDAKAAGVDRSKYIRALVQGAGKVGFEVLHWSGLIW